jgi:ABC-type nitrate/sulfonate/bicarbonate transport system substrate-binding protein
VQPFLGAAPAVNAALAAGELDIVEYFGFPAVMSRANGLRHNLISVTWWGSNWVLVAGADSGIETIYDLRGKTIAYMNGTGTHLYLLNVLSEAGLAPEDIVHIDDVSVAEGLTGVAIGRFDATIVISGQETLFEESVRVVHRGFLADEATFFEPMVLIARSAFYDEHPEVAVAVQKALLRARDRGRQDEPAFYQTVSEVTGLDFDALMAVAILDFDARYPLNLGDRYMNRLKHTLEFLRTYGFTDGEVDFDAWHGGGRAIRLANEYFNSN